MATKKIKEEILHKDLLGRDIILGDAVAFTHKNDLVVGKIAKVTPKQLRVVPLKGYTWRSTDGFLKYPEQCVLVGGEDLVVWILRNT